MMCPLADIRICYTFIQALVLTVSYYCYIPQILQLPTVKMYIYQELMITATVKCHLGVTLLDFKIWILCYENLAKTFMYYNGLGFDLCRRYGT